MNQAAQELFKNLFRNEAFRSSPTSRRPDRKLTLEQLENRQLLAADLTWGFEASPGVFEAGGTEAADVFVFQAGDENHTLTMNGVSQTVSASDFSRFIFRTSDPADSVEMIGNAQQQDKFFAWSDRAKMEGDGFRVDAYGFAAAAAVGHAGEGDRAYLYGTNDTDKVDCNPTTSKMETSELTEAEAEGFDRVYIYGYGGDDTAHFEDGTGDDKFLAKDTYATFDSPESYIKATDFEHVDAIAINGGYDKAYQYDTSANDLLVVNEESVRMLSPERDSAATGFERNYSYSKQGGEDHLRVYDSIFDENFDLESLVEDRGRKNGLEVQASFMRLFGGNFYRRAEGFLVSDMLEVNPRYLIGEMAESGAVDVNIEYEMGVSDTYFIEMQRYGAELIAAGLGIQSDDMVTDGISVIQWGIDQQQADGSFTSGDAMHSTALFQHAVGISIEDLDFFGYETFDEAKRSEWIDSLTQMSNWMIANDEATAEVDLEPFTHRYFMRAAGLMRAAQLTGNSEFALEANQYFSQGLAKMTEDGVLPERGGFDINYQSLALRYAGEFYRMTTDTLQRESIRMMFEASLPWISERIDADGNVDTSDSTRSGEDGRNGTNKSFDEISAVRAYLSGYEVTGDETWLTLANAVFQHDKTAV